MKVDIIDDVEEAVSTLDCFGRFTGHDVRIWTDRCPDAATLGARLRDTEILIPLRGRTLIGEELLGLLPRLRLISQSGAVPHIDLAACTRRGILVSSLIRTRPPHGTAELAWGLIIAALRDLCRHAMALREGRWESSLGQNLHGRTLGVFGYGRVGQLVAGYGKAFGMRVLIWGRDATLARARQDGFETASSREAFFSEADVLTLHLRLCAQTRHLIDERDLALMKPTALFVNTARAELVAPGALANAMRSGRPGRAAVDVFETEPVDGRNPLTSQANVVCTPHLGYLERDSHEYAYGNAFAQIEAYAAGRPINICNPEAIELSKETLKS